MNSRLIKGLSLTAGVLLLALIALTVLKRPQASSAPFSKAMDQSETITLQTGAVKMELQKEGTVWQISSSTEPGRYRADPDKLKTLLNGLQNLKLEDVISERQENVSEFEVDAASGTRVTLLDKKKVEIAAGI